MKTDNYIDWNRANRALLRKGYKFKNIFHMTILKHSRFNSIKGKFRDPAAKNNA